MDLRTDDCTEGSYTVTRTWTLTDDCGNSTSGVQTITVLDTINPTFTAPSDITLYADASCLADVTTSTTGDVSDESDNCTTSLDASYVDVLANNCTGSYVIERTWSLVDACGNAAADQLQTITVLDTVSPTFTTPGDITLYVDASCTVDSSPSGASGDVTDELDSCSTGLDATYVDVEQMIAVRAAIR